MSADENITSENNENSNNSESRSSDWGLCSVCNSNQISISRNKDKTCKNCRQILHRNPKRKATTPFSFERGCFNALADKNSNEDVAFYSHGPKLLKTKPLAFSIGKKQKGNDSAVVTGLFNDVNINKMLEAGISFTNGQNLNDLYECTVTLPEDEEMVAPPVVSNDEYIKNMLKTTYPKIDTSLGPFEELDQTVIELISQDLRLNQNLIPEVAQLFTGSIVAYRDTTLLVVTTEIYSRASSLDIHAENEYLVSSMPKKNKTRYPDYFIGTVLSADGKKTKSKLEMGTKSMNILCTSSIALDKSLNVFVGPETGIIFDPKDTKLYLIKESVDKFKELVKPADDRFPSIDSIRQVTSGFQSPTTYKRWRRTLSSFDDYIHKSATIFTLCDLPNNGGYGSNDGSFSRCASQFMQFLARATITNSGVAERDEFNVMLANYELHKGDAKNWKTLDSIIRLMEDKFESDANINIYKFSNECNLSDIIPGISSAITSANNKIKENIQARFETLYF